MKDDFDERLARRLSALDAAVPPPAMKEGVMSAGKSTRVSSRFPLGFAAGLVAIVAVVALASAALRMSSNVGATESTGPSESAAVPTASVATPAGTATLPSTGMVIANVQAIPFAGTGNPVSVIATIENRTGADDRLLGASSPIAATGGLYASCGCTPGSTDPSGMGNKSLVPSWLIRAGETIELRTGDGEIILNGLAEPLVAGEQLEVTFEFEDAAPVTVTVPVVSSTD
jgi:copper(I)-binding protein